MTQPSFVPIAEADQMRPSLRLEVHPGWSSDRVAELTFPVRPGGKGRGTPGPDQGYALRLARRFEDRFCLSEDESAEDVIVGCALLASRRAGLFGRAPSTFDLQAAFNIWSVLTPAPADLVAVRHEAFRSASHEYVVQRAIVDRVPESALRLSPGDLATRVAAGNWAELVGEVQPA